MHFLDSVTVRLLAAAPTKATSVEPPSIICREGGLHKRAVARSEAVSVGWRSVLAAWQYSSEEPPAPHSACHAQRRKDAAYRDGTNEHRKVALWEPSRRRIVVGTQHCIGGYRTENAKYQSPAAFS